MLFKAYPANVTVPYAFYPDGIKDAKISKRAGGLSIDAPDLFTTKRISDFLLSNGIDIEHLGLRDLYAALDEKNLLKAYGRGQSKGKAYTQKPSGSNKRGQSLGKSPQNLIVESLLLDLKKAVFCDMSIVDDITVIISSNEPTQLSDLFNKSHLTNIHRAHLDIADIVIVRQSTGDTLFVERKTIQDLGQSVIVGAHCHDQSERMAIAVNDIRKQGKRARAIWMIEAQDNGFHLLDSALPLIQSVSGLTNYLDFINEQSVFQSYSMKHTVYHCLKFAQGFFEQTLVNHVQSDNPLVMRSGEDRLASKVIHNSDGNAVRNTGVTRHNSTELAHMLSYIPSLNIAVAKELAATGKSFAEVTQMTQAELEATKGVGKKTAALIYQAFNQRQV